LADVVACNSSICLVDGDNCRLLYRGYDIVDLAEHSTFEEVAYLLWYGRLPGFVEFQAFLDGFTGCMKLPVETVMILRMFPHAATPMEVLRTAVSSLGHWDPDSGNTRLDACLRKAQRLTERIPMIIASHQRLRDGKEPIEPRSNSGIAFNFLYTLQGREPDPIMVKAMDTALILHADHELNASTFAARVTAATMTDIYSAMTSAIAALKGPLHGGANAEVMKMLEEIATPEQAADWVLPRLAKKKKIPGFGHRVYRCEDPRATVLRGEVQKSPRSLAKLAITKLSKRWSNLCGPTPRCTPTSISIPPRCITPWAFLRSCSPRFLPSAGPWAGLRTSSNNGK